MVLGLNSLLAGAQPAHARCLIAGVAGARLPEFTSGRDGQRKTSYPSELAAHSRNFQCVRELDLLAKKKRAVEGGWRWSGKSCEGSGEMEMVGREMEMDGRWDGDGVVKQCRAVLEGDALYRGSYRGSREYWSLAHEKAGAGLRFLCHR